jgi:hypothetical protein
MRGRHETATLCRRDGDADVTASQRLGDADCNATLAAGDAEAMPKRRYAT